MLRRLPRPVLLVVVALQAVSAALAWRDLSARDDSQVRGRKIVWRVVITFNPGNSLAYWAIGRR